MEQIPKPGSATGMEHAFKGVYNWQPVPGRAPSQQGNHMASEFRFQTLIFLISIKTSA